MVEDLILKNWYIGYTFPMAEKKVHATLQKMGVTSFLPMHTVMRKWSDRIKKVIVPLFPSYIFINVTSSERFNLMRIDGFIRYISFGGKPSVISNTIIESLKKMLTVEAEVTNEVFDKIGMPVLITEGPFAGVKGILVKKKNRMRLILQICALQKSVSVDIAASSVTPVAVH